MANDDKLPEPTPEQLSANAKHEEHITEVLAYALFVTDCNGHDAMTALSVALLTVLRIHSVSNEAVADMMRESFARMPDALAGELMGQAMMLLDRRRRRAKDKLEQEQK